MWNSTGIFPVLLVLLSCSGPEGAEVHLADDVGPGTTERDLLSDLLGDWRDAQREGATAFHEHWSEDADGHMNGMGVVLSGMDTVWIERLRILRSDSGTWYEATIPTQNESLPVRFELTHSTDSLVFSDPEHDFPQHITYVPMEDGGWTVRVSGMEEGLMRVEQYRFVRQ